MKRSFHATLTRLLRETHAAATEAHATGDGQLLDRGKGDGVQVDIPPSAGIKSSIVTEPAINRSTSGLPSRVT